VWEYDEIAGEVEGLEGGVGTETSADSVDEAVGEAEIDEVDGGEGAILSKGGLEGFAQVLAATGEDGIFCSGVEDGV
jgi:hypothetical protein